MKKKVIRLTESDIEKLVTKIIKEEEQLEMDFGDVGNTKGYYVLNLDDMEYEFIQNTISPNYIKISLSHEPHEQGGKLNIRVEDSGDGFDYQQHTKNLANNATLSGRGGGLLQQLCSEYSYSGKGNISNAVYIWAA